MFTHIGRAGRTALIAGLLIATASGVALVSGSHGASAATRAHNGASAAPSTPRGHRHGWGRALKGPRGAFLARGKAPLLKVSSVNGNTINAATQAGRAITVTVSATTAYTEAGSTAALSDIQAGELIRVRGTRTRASSVQARAVVIVLPRVAGVVTSVSGATLTVTGRDALPHTINTDSSTRYLSGGQSASFSDVKVGSAIVAQGKLNADGSLTAVRVAIVLPHVSGKVTGVSGSTVTIANVWGQTYTVNTSSSTTYVAPGGVTATLSSVTPGERIVAAGTLGANAQTINATRIRIMPLHRAGPAGPKGGFGQGANL